MKKNLLLIGIIIIAAAVLLSFAKIQSVDEYYLEHIDDITEDSETVTLSIVCGAVLDRWDDLEPQLKDEKYVPPDGVIMPPAEYVLRPGDTVFDILHRAARYHKIQMEFHGSEKNGLGNTYIKGINYLYEFSCGPQSGWIFKVNGQPAGYGCGSYKLNDGDIVEWVYTCDLGRDAGGSF